LAAAGTAGGGTLLSRRFAIGGGGALGLLDAGAWRSAPLIVAARTSAFAVRPADFFESIPTCPPLTRLSRPT
jgi:hypothetical protein